MKTVKQVLMDARHKIQDGWIQGNFGDGKGMCAAGAIYSSCAESVGDLVTYGAYREKEKAARALLAESIGTDNIATWNDVPGRTKFEVLDAFDRAVTFAHDRSL